MFGLRDKSGPQVYGLGVKELWDVPADKHKPGRVIHTQGWPLEDAWGGGFLYHQENNQVALGLRRRARLFEPVRVALRGIPALEDAPRDPRGDRRRPPRLLRRAGDQRGRVAGHSRARLPGRSPDRLLGGLRERAAHQGHAHGDEVGDAGGRSGLRGARATTARTIRWRPIRRLCGRAGSTRSFGSSAMRNPRSPISAAPWARSTPASTCGLVRLGFDCHGR